MPCDALFGTQTGRVRLWQIKHGVRRAVPHSYPAKIVEDILSVGKPIQAPTYITRRFRDTAPLPRCHRMTF